MKLIGLVTGLFVVLSSFTGKAPIENHEIDVNASNVKWTGYHLAKSYEHSGNIKIKNGNVGIESGELTSGAFVIDMTSLSNTDLTKPKDNTKLVNDLKSKRFFNVDEFPEAKLEFSEAHKQDDGYHINGTITIRGIAKGIEFNVKKVKEDAESIHYSATLEVDRIEHEVMYGWSIENAMLSNKFDLEVLVVAKK